MKYVKYLLLSSLIAFPSFASSLADILVGDSVNNIVIGKEYQQRNATIQAEKCPFILNIKNIVFNCDTPNKYDLLEIRNLSPITGNFNNGGATGVIIGAAD
jgi:transcription elongation factor GreA-like protein